MYAAEKVSMPTVPEIIQRARKERHPHPDIPQLQGLSAPCACVGSGDPVRVLRLYTMNTLDIL